MTKTNVVACVKPVPLGEPAIARGRLVLDGVAWGLPASERRVLAAAGIAARALGAEPVALALGPRGAAAGLREALALGAQRAVLVDAGEAHVDALLTARGLAQAVTRLGAQLVLTGAASADARQGVLGPMLAELLGLELVGDVEQLDAQGLVAHRAAGGEDERWRIHAPAVLTISPRFSPAGHATSWGVGASASLPLETWTLAELLPDARSGSDDPTLSRVEQRKVEAERFEGEPEDVAAQLVRRLRAAGVPS